MVIRRQLHTRLPLQSESEHTSFTMHDAYQAISLLVLFVMTSHTSDCDGPWAGKSSVAVNCSACSC